MKEVFADTSYYAALFNERDARHAHALAQSRKIRGPVVTTEFVLLELGATMSPAKSRGRYVELIEIDRKSTRLNSSHLKLSRMPSSA